VRPICSDASTLSADNCAAAASNRNGVSLNTNPNISDQPSASGTTQLVGGLCQPVSRGENRRTSQPLGAMRKARPTAIAACGTASSGGRLASNQRHQRVLCTHTNVSTVNSSTTVVAVRPVFSDRNTAGNTRGSVSISAKPLPGAKLGIKPSAGNSVPPKPSNKGRANKVARQRASRLNRSIDLSCCPNG